MDVCCLALAHGIDQRRIQAEHVKPDNRYFPLAVAEYHGGSVEIMQDALDPQSARLDWKALPSGGVIATFAAPAFSSFAIIAPQSA